MRAGQAPAVIAVPGQHERARHIDDERAETVTESAAGSGATGTRSLNSWPACDFQLVLFLGTGIVTQIRQGCNFQCRFERGGELA